MNTYYIRHTKNLGVCRLALREYWERDAILIHSATDSSSRDPDDYNIRGEKSAMRCMKELAENGGYVCAEHWLDTKGECLIGRVDPGTEIQVSVTCLERDPSHMTHVKWIPLLKTKRLTAIRNAALLVGRPRQGTMSRWHKVGTRVQYLVEDENRRPNLHDLFPFQHEVMCADFLRNRGDAYAELPYMERLLIPPGRTLRDIDIAGVANDGRPLYAQVTCQRETEAGWKLDKLSKFVNEGSAHVIIFCSCESVNKQRGVIIVPIESVFEQMTSGPVGINWLKLALTGAAE